MPPLLEAGVPLVKRGNIEVGKKYICESDLDTPDGPLFGWGRAEFGLRPSECEWGKESNDAPPPPKSERYGVENNPDLHPIPK